MKKLLMVLMALMLVSAIVPFAFADDDDDELKLMTEASTTIKEVLGIPENGIPQEMLDNAAAVVVVPDLIKAAFIAGLKNGDGVLSVHGQKGWTHPAFIDLDGGSVGFQAGVEETDLVLVFMSEKHVKKLLNGEFTFGADASVTAGPVGRTASVGTNENAKSAIYAYSRSAGLFVGISLDGSKIGIDEDSNVKIYGAGATASNILYGEHGKAPKEAEDLKTTLNNMTKANNMKAKS